MSLKRRLEKLELSKPKPSPVPQELERAIARLTPGERRALRHALTEAAGEDHAALARERLGSVLTGSSSQAIAALKDIIAREPAASREAKDAAILLLELYEAVLT